MNIINFKYACASCGNHFLSPDVPEQSYGEFVMRSEKTGEVVYLNAITDSVFSEVCAIVKECVVPEKYNVHQIADLQQKVFSEACDLAPDQSRFRIGLPPICPKCGARTPASWEPASLSEKVLLHEVTHRHWNRLSKAERREAIIFAITRAT